MAYNLSSAGFLAFLMRENSNQEKYIHIHHASNKFSACQRHTFYFNQTADKMVGLIINEEENQRDALEPNCCKLFRAIEVEFDIFFNADEQNNVKNDILKYCSRANKGLGFGHCKFLESELYKNNGITGPFFINKGIKRSCTKKNAS
jgi:hypothetical protein